MPTPRTLFDETRQLPDPIQGSNFDAVEGTQTLVDLCDGVNGVACKVGEVVIPRVSMTSTSLAEGGTLTPTHALHKVSGSLGAVSIAGVYVGVKDRQLLILQGGANAVTIPQTAGGVLLQGDITLTLGVVLCLRWDEALSLWIEYSRSNPLDLTNQRSLSLRESNANGTNRVTIKAPASLAADYDLTLPATLSEGGFLQVDGSGIITINPSSSTLDTAYNGGSTVAVDAAAILLNGASGLADFILKLVSAAAAQGTLRLQKTGVGVGPVLEIENAGTGADIEGTADAWAMSKLGELALARLTASGSSASPIAALTQAGAGPDIRGTSSSWQVSKAGAATFADLQLGGPVIDVRYYGALGDGSADDTAEIQAAIDAAEAGAWKVVYLPPGTYNVGTLTMKSGVRLCGSGYGTILSAVGIAAYHAVIEANNKRDWSIEKLKIDGNSAGSTLLADSLGILVTGTGGDCENFLIDDVWLWDCHYRALNIRSAVCSRVRNIFIEGGCDEIGFLVGTNADETFTVRGLQMEHIIVRNVLTDGGGVWRQTLTGTVKEVSIDGLITYRTGLANAGHGFFTHGAQDILVNNFSVSEGQHANGNGLQIEGDKRIRFTNGSIRDMLLYGIVVTGVYPTDISFSNIAINGCQRGVVIEGNTNTPAQRLHFTDVDVSECEYDGWYLAGWYVFLTNCTAADNGQAVGNYAGFFLQSALANGKPLHVHFTGCHAYDSGVSIQAYGISFGDNCDRIYIDSTSYFQGFTEGVHFANVNTTDDVYFALGKGPTGLQRRTNGTAAPVAYTWEVGDIVWNTAPTAGGTLCWVCVTAGTPGTWKAVAVAA